MHLVREICGYDRETEWQVWSTPIDEDSARTLAPYLDTEGDEDLLFVYDLEGEPLKMAARLAGFEIRPDLDYTLEASSGQ
ncbi:hypothetical protein O4J56_10405 [Nocardiopsis sp. RSe5-2]|uniref:DUF7683 domain-containing protein n=1 Tax=Nocardiopsis endophytica TaxID=3018445 RepID=A0ABT4U411_9ACTN|nr:hypothetical protein [Nocardiopsis endophytica]MDA2811047.1 hypothetical protein [Nocardiopsis endophytica]